MATSELCVDVAPGDVYAALVDVERYPDWLVGAKKILSVDPAWPEPGAGFVHEVGVGPIRLEDRTTLLAATPGSELVLRVRARPLLKAEVRFEVRTVGPGARLTMAEVPVGMFRWLTPVIAPLVKLRNDRSLALFARVFGFEVSAEPQPTTITRTRSTTQD